MKLPLRSRKGNSAREARLPSHLPEHPSDGIGTLAWRARRRIRQSALNQLQNQVAGMPAVRTVIQSRLSRHRRAGPSASLDKSADWGYWIVAR